MPLYLASDLLKWCPISFFPMSETASALITMSCGYFLPLSLAYGSSKAVAKGTTVSLHNVPLSFLCFFFSCRKGKHYCNFWLRCQNTKLGSGSTSAHMWPGKSQEGSVVECCLIQGMIAISATPIADLRLLRRVFIWHCSSLRYTVPCKIFILL